MIILFLLTFILLIAFSVLFFLYDWKEIKGKFAEVVVSLSMRIFLGRQYIVLDNLFLPSNDFKKTQIDHIIIGPTGIFVLETKNMSGEIYGKADSGSWVQIFKDFNRRSFLNPIKQNNIHVRATRKLLGNKYHFAIYNCVVFFSPKLDKIECSENINTILGTLKNIKEKGVVLEKGDVLEIAKIISSASKELSAV